jgi:hypothetical protein
MGGVKMRIKTKKTIISCGLAIVLSLTACSTTEVPKNDNEQILEDEFAGITNVSINRFHGNSIMADRDGNIVHEIDFPFLLDSGLVVIGEFVGESHGGFRHKYVEELGEYSGGFPWSFNQLRIIEVLQGDIEVGEIITVSGKYVINRERGSLSIFDCDLTPMRKGDRWIFFIGLFENAVEYFEVLEHEVGLEIAKNGPIYGGNGVYRYPLPTLEIAQSMERSSLGSLRQTDEIETSALGVFTRNEFDFEIYAQVLEHFQIEPQDWVNPGRAFDARLIEIVENR